LIDNFHSYLSTSRNADFIQWSALRKAIERTEGHVLKQMKEAKKIIKTIGLLNLFSSAAAHLNLEFLVDYANYCLGIDNSNGLIAELEDKKIIRFIQYKQSYILFEGSDLNIDLALKRAESKVDIPQNIVPKLNEYFEMPFVLAKKMQYETGIPRVFKFELIDKAQNLHPREEIDGIVQLVIGVDETAQQVSRESEEALLIGVSRSIDKIRNTLFEIEKTNTVIADAHDDLVALRELEGLKSHLIGQLNELVANSIYQGGFDWYFQGEKREINSSREFNQLLTTICERVYSDVPTFKNELINRHNLSSSIGSARGEFFKMLVENHAIENLGFPENNYPPQKTIYQTLLKETGIHRKDDNGDFILSNPTEESFFNLWETCERFMDSAKSKRRNLQDFFGLLTEPPLKLKYGFIYFWLPTYLFVKRNDFALYHEGTFVPELNAKTIDIIYKRPDKFEIKAFDLEGVRLEIFNRYRELVQKDYEEKPNQEAFLETIKPFLVFHKQLPKYTKNTKTGLSIAAVNFREAISQAKDPETLFFEEIPNALSFRNLSEEGTERIELFTNELQKVITELREAYQELLNRFENVICEEIGLKEIDFLKAKQQLQNRFEGVNRAKLLPK
jgi:hypothetical protein